MNGLRRIALSVLAVVVALCVTCACAGPLAPIAPGVLAPGEGPDGSSISVEQKQPSGEVTPDVPFVPDVGEIEESSRQPILPDDSVAVNYSNAVLKVANGTFDTADGAGQFADYTSTSRDALVACLKDETPFAFGTIEFGLRTNTTADSGVIFGVSSPVDLFWEGKGVEYYFFFFNHEGYAYLGKCDNGGWWVIEQVTYGYNAVDTYRMKVVFEGNKICCYVNGALVIDYRDPDFSTGTGWGFRTNEIGVTFSDIEITSEYRYGEEQA